MTCALNLAYRKEPPLASPKRILVTLRFLILGTMVLLATTAGRSAGAGGDASEAPGWLFWFVATLYLVSNFIYALEAVEHFFSQRITSWIFLFDVALVTVLFSTSHVSSDDFWIPYFLTILLAALAADVRVALIAAVVSAAVYGFVLTRSQPAPIFTDRYFLHAAFYVVTALFVGTLAESAKRERTRRGGIQQALQLSHRIADLFDLSRIIDLSRDPRGLAKYILDLSQELFSGDAGSLMLVDEKSEELRVAVARGFDPVEGRADPRGIAAYIARTGEPLLLIGPPHSDSRFSHLEARPEIRSSISVPIRYRDEIFGVLNFNRTNPHVPNFTEVDMAKASSFAVHVGVALANARTFKRLDDKHLLALDNLATLRQTQSETIRTEKHTTLEEVITSVARSLNDPLTGILGAAALASESLPADSEFAGAISAITADANRCRDLVAQLQSVQRAQRPNRVPTNIAELVQEVLLEHDEAFRRAGIALMTEYGPGLHIVQVDRQMMTRVFTHLIENAIAAMEARTDAIRRLQIDIYNRDHRTHVAVSDSGVGVGLDHIQSLFQPFRGTRQVGRSVGMGLLTVQRLVRDHGGTVSAHTDGLDGTTFVVSLPSSNAHEPLWGVDGKRKAPFAWPLSTTNPLSAAPQAVEDPYPSRLLLVESDPSVARVVSDALSKTHKVQTVGSPEMAIQMLRASQQNGELPFSALILDLTLPGGGTQLHQRIRAELPDFADRIVFTSSATLSAEQARILDSTSAPYLTKPFSIDDLRDAVRAVST